MMCSMAGFMGTGHLASNSPDFTLCSFFIWSSVNSALFECAVHVARKADNCTVTLREMDLPACLVQGIAGH
jgi:hypothetical protein